MLVYRSPSGNDDQATAAKIVLQDIKVFAVDTQTESKFTATKDEQTEPMTAKTIALLVTPAAGRDPARGTRRSAGTLRLVLRNPEDDVQVVDHEALRSATSSATNATRAIGSPKRSCPRRKLRT